MRLRDLFADRRKPRSTRPSSRCEQEGDRIVSSILQRLNTTFVTPFDREDIHALAEELDDVVDDMLEVSHRISATGITRRCPS